VLNHRGILPSHLSQVVVGCRNAPDVLLVDPVIDQDMLVIFNQLQGRILKLRKFGMWHFIQGANLFQWVKCAERGILDHCHWILVEILEVLAD
jgi:hypothetical protein